MAFSIEVALRAHFAEPAGVVVPGWTALERTQAALLERVIPRVIQVAFRQVLVED
jgi:hypothetical protein